MLIKSPLKKEKVKANRRTANGPRPKTGGNGKNFRNGNTSYGKRIAQNGKKKKRRISFPQPWKVIVGAVIVGVCGVLYLNHLFATQQLLQEVQQLEREYNQAKRMYDDYRLTYDRMIGPSEIHDKAKELGFINGGPAEKVIEVD